MGLADPAGNGVGRGAPWGHVQSAAGPCFGAGPWSGWYVISPKNQHDTHQWTRLSCETSFRNVGMDTADRLGLGCGMAIFLFLPGTPRLVIGYLQRKGQIAVLFISTPSDYSSDPYVSLRRQRDRLHDLHRRGGQPGSR